MKFNIKIQKKNWFFPNTFVEFDAFLSLLLSFDIFFVNWFILFDDKMTFIEITFNDPKRQISAPKWHNL